MHWLLTHRYVTALAGAGLLLVLGALIVSNRAAVNPVSDSPPRAWSGANAGASAPVRNPLDRPLVPRERENLYTDVTGGAPFVYAPANAQIPAYIPEDEDFDFDEFLATLSHKPGGEEAEDGGDSELDPYSLIPSGLISVVNSDETGWTEVQQTLYDYGNEVGSTIQSYENTYRNAPRILRDQFEDRQNPAKNDALRDLAGGLANVGYSLEGMEEIRSEVQTAHDRLAASYKEMGELLARIPDAKGDDSMLEAMLAYNETVDTFIKNFISLALLFSAHGVTFSQDDPGSVFVFTNVSAI